MKPIFYGHLFLAQHQISFLNWILTPHLATGLLACNSLTKKEVQPRSASGSDACADNNVATTNMPCVPQNV